MCAALVGALAPVAPARGASVTTATAEASATADPVVEELLWVNEGNRMRRIAVESIGSGALREEVFIERAGLDPERGRDVNGQICALEDGSGRFVTAEDTDQATVPPGWGVFSAAGEQVGKLTATSFISNTEPAGCAVGPDGTLFTAEVGSQGFGANNGQLIMWFPPFDEFPGEPGTYPNAEFSTNYCKLAVDLGTAGSVAVDGDGNVYVAESSGLRVNRFSPPFPTGPDAEGGCGQTDALGSPLADAVQRETFIEPADGMLTFAGLAFGPNGNLFVSSVLTGRIAEYDLDGNLVRLIVAPAESLPPVPTGHPQGIGFDAAGTLYYADLDLQGTLPNVRPGPNGKVWRVRFDDSGDPLAPEIVREGLAFPDGLVVLPGTLTADPVDPVDPERPTESRTYAGGPERHFLFDDPFLTLETAPTLKEKWRFPTGAIVTSSPAVAAVDLPGEGLVQVVYFSSWDGFIYALRFSDGSELWRFDWDEQPGASFPGAASVHVEEIDGVDVVIAPAGQSVYALDAVTGEERWRFSAGTGCRDDEGEPPGGCGFGGGERNETLSSPIVAEGNVYFGMDVNESPSGKGGFYAVDVRTGTLTWYFDLVTGSTCRPFADDEVRRFDGYHSAGALGLPEDFFATRPGCDFDRTPNGCGSVWSSAALDEDRATLYVGTSNCYTSEDPASPRPMPPMPPYEAALLAIDLDGDPQWKWRPREVDNDDLAFGAVPNLFRIDVDGTERDVVGIGNKDGSYTVVDRDGVNQRSGVAWDDEGAAEEFPYWRTRVVDGGAIGGVVATASVDEGNRRVRFATAPGLDVFVPQRPTVHVLDMDTGAVVWQNPFTEGIESDASYSPTSGTPELVVVGSAIFPVLRIFDAATGDLVYIENIAPGSFSGIGSGAVIVDGTLLVGHGLGTRTANPNSQSNLASWIPSSLVALCVPGAPDCPPDPVTFSANFSAEDCATFEAIAGRFELDEGAAQVVRSGVRGLVRLAEAGGAFPIAPPANDGPCEISLDWAPAGNGDIGVGEVAVAAAAFGVTPEELHHLGGRLMLVLIWQAALREGLVPS